MNKNDKIKVIKNILLSLPDNDQVRYVLNGSIGTVISVLSNGKIRVQLSIGKIDLDPSDIQLATEDDIKNEGVLPVVKCI